MKNKNILVVGDVHGYFGELNCLISKRHPLMILACGDFGYWPKEKGYDLTKIKNKISTDSDLQCEIHFCDGNHEDHDEFKKFNNQVTEIVPGVFYHPRGSTLELEDGRRILFMGGAESIDKQFRTPGYDWFPEETISQKDIINLPDVDIDIVISHTCPSEFNIWGRNENSIYKQTDPSRHALSVVFNTYHPKLWYFGHWHHYLTGTHQGCKWTMLNRDHCTMWWDYLEEEC